MNEEVLEISTRINKIGIGLLCYDTENLGDWTQTAAALFLWWNYFNRPNTFEHFLKTSIETSIIDLYPIIWVKRDLISIMEKPEKVNKVILLCNAWWMHPNNKKKYNIITPDWIHPIYISIHLKDAKILTPEAILHFKKYEPIGCRDNDTKRLLNNKGIEAYFYGCLTMALNFNDPEFGFVSNNEYSNKIIFIDYSTNEQEGEDVISITQRMTINDNINNIMFSLQRCVDLLNAKEIKTTRLHVWLPLVCNYANITLISKHTGLKFINGDKDNNDQEINRFSGLTEVVYDTANLSVFRRILINKGLTEIQKAVSLLNQ
jgi:hypothetical protein